MSPLFTLNGTPLCLSFLKKLESFMKLKIFLSLFLLLALPFVVVEGKATRQYQQAKISSSAYQHIKDRHWYNANSGNQTSHFNSNMTAYKLNGIATKTLNSGRVNHAKGNNGRKVHEYRFNKPIGTTTNGQKAKTLRVVSDGNGNVITAFPIK